MSKSGQSTFNRRREVDPGPAEANDAVWVERVDDAKDDTRGVVREVTEFPEHDSPAQLVVATEHDGEIVTTRERVRVVTGADADLFRSVIGGDDA